MISNELRRLNRLYSEIDAAYHEAAFRLGVSDSELRILYALCSENSCRPLSDVVQESGLTKQTVNSALRKMEREGLLYLQPEGKRSKLVCLTETGKNLAGRSALRLMELEDAVYAEWSSDELRLYLALTERYVNSFREKIKVL